jgi:hypothetical protein
MGDERPGGPGPNPGRGRNIHLMVQMSLQRWNGPQCARAIRFPADSTAGLWPAFLVDCYNIGECCRVTQMLRSR